MRIRCTGRSSNALERLVNQIVEQGDELLRDAGIAFPSRAVSTVLLLGERGPISAADIARELTQPHQLVTQRIDLLIDLGIIARAHDPHDARRKVLNLTPKGRRQFQRLKRRLASAEAAFAVLFDEIGCDLSAAAQRARDALDRSSILTRVQSIEATTASILPASPAVRSQ